MDDCRQLDDEGWVEGEVVEYEPRSQQNKYSSDRYIVETDTFRYVIGGDTKPLQEQDFWIVGTQIPQEFDTGWRK